MKDRIYTIYMSEQEFGSQNHLNNFIKYLFSNSQKHKKNLNTKYNFVCDILENYEFLTNEYEKKFRKEFNKVLDFKRVTNDLTYVSFAININDNIITNILERDESEFITVLDPNMAKYIVGDYYNSDEEFEEDINTIFNEAKNIIPFSEVSDLEIRKTIEMKIRSTLYERNKENTFFSISHNDQNQLYHIHRLNLNN